MPAAPADAGVSDRVRHARRLFADIARGYDVIGGVLSFGQDRRWRSFLVSNLDVCAGSRVLDVATGTAAVAIDVARRRGSGVVGVDQSPEMLLRGRAAVERAGLRDRVRFVLGRAERLPFPDETFDAVTFTYLLRYVDDPGATLPELTRVLRPGGMLASLEFGVPPRTAWRVGWSFHARVGLPVLGALFSPGWYRAGRFLGPSILHWEERFPLSAQVELWRRAGIGRTLVRPMTFGAGVVILGRKRG